MAFSTQNFLSYVNRNRGLAQGSRFQVSIGLHPRQKEMLQFMCQEAVIPGKEIETMEKNYGYGTTRQLPKSEKYENVTLKFRCTNGRDRKGYPEWNFFYGWMERVIDTGTNMVGYRKDYVRNVYIDTFNLENELLHQVLLPNAYPIKMGDIPLSTEQKEVEFELTLACDYVIHNGQLADAQTRRLEAENFRKFTETGGFTGLTPEEERNPKVGPYEFGRGGKDESYKKHREATVEAASDIPF